MDAKVLQRKRGSILSFIRNNWVGTVVILLATLVFFWPIVTRLATYSEGGDAMFNAWTLARDHHCITFDGCPNYADGNIFFPHKYTMFYSETQLSTGILTLPLYAINNNPVFAFNVWTIISFFLGGWFMYLLAKRLSKGNEVVSVLAGLIFEFAPFKMAAVAHLQSLSIFYLPLAVLLIIKFFDTSQKRYLFGLFITLTLLFYASWYQSVFALIGILVLLIAMFIGKQISLRQVRYVISAVAAAGVMVLPLAVQYIQFSNSTRATFSIGEQVALSSSVYDYLLPHFGTFLGKIYYHLFPGTHPNAYNIDSFSYHGVILYILAGVMTIAALLAIRVARRKHVRLKRGDKTANVFVLAFVAIAFVGFIISLGPLLKWKESAGFALTNTGAQIVVPMPWLAVDYLVPQLQFIRAIGRASVLTLFGLTCVLAYLPIFLSNSKFKKRTQRIILAVVVAVAVFELLPAHRVIMAQGSYAYNKHVPAIYKMIKNNPKIDNIIILRSDRDYPEAPFTVARTEDVLWAGYHNKNIYNGYSGYMPPRYFEDYADFVDLRQDDIAKMKKLGLKYVIVDKHLSSTGDLLTAAKEILKQRVYEDNRYVLFGLF